MKFRIPFALTCASILGLWLLLAGCLQTPVTEEYIQLQLPDSLYSGDTVRIDLVTDTLSDSAETLFQGALSRREQVSKLPTKTYAGGAVIIDITYFRGGNPIRMIRLLYPGNRGAAILITINLPPPLLPREPDSVFTLHLSRNEWSFYSDSLVPDSSDKVCSLKVNGQEQKTFAPNALNAPNPLRQGKDSLVWVCEWPEGQVRVSQYQVVTNLGATLKPPKIAYSLVWSAADSFKGQSGDTLKIDSGVAMTQAGGQCRKWVNDTLVTTFMAKSQNVFDSLAPGIYPMVWTCADSTGHVVAQDTQIVIVIALPKPLVKQDTTYTITLIGLDTARMVQGDTLPLLGANCHRRIDSGAITHFAPKITGLPDTSKVGTTTLVYACEEPTGNSRIAKNQVIIVAARPIVKQDTTYTITLIGLDTMSMVQGVAIPAHGATCHRRIDGGETTNFAPKITGLLDTSKVGTTTLVYACEEPTGNLRIAKNQVVIVAARPIVKHDTTYTITLIGLDSVRMVQGEAIPALGANCYRRIDSGATTNFAPKTTGLLDTSKIGTTTLVYACEEPTGNLRIAKNQVVIVAARPIVKHDTTYTITLIGLDSVRMVQGEAIPALGANCYRRIDSGATTNFAPKTTGVLDTSIVGKTTLAYACEEPTGISRITKNQVVIVAARPITSRTLLATKDIHFDLRNTYQQGLSPVLGLYPKDSTQANAIAFDLTQVQSGRLVSGNIRLLTYISSQPWDTVVTWTARIRSLQRDWMEGTGNHYWHNGTWKNGGDVIFANHPFSSDLKARSQNPLLAPGVKADSAQLWMDANLDSVTTLQVTAKYKPGPSVPLPMAPQLTQVDLDITDYLKTADLSKNFGFYIQINGAEGYVVSCMSRELQNGAIGPKLILQEQ